MEKTNLEENTTTQTETEQQVKKYRYQNTKQRQKMFVAAFVKNNALVQITCEEIGINRDTYYTWLQKYPDFKKMVDDAIEHKLDLLENRLNKLIEKGDTQATIFAVKCLLKHRGYKEKQEVEVSGNVNVNILNVDPISNNE